MSTTLQPARKADHPIEAQFIDRWSQRAFSGEPIPDSVLFTVLEAARWAPSGGNAQPWRFIYSRKGSPSWDTFVAFLKPGNQRWAPQASALILIVSQTHKLRGVVVKAESHSFDAGAAWAHLALQAHALGWSTRAIGGFEKDQARQALGVPDDYALEAVVALGRPDSDAKAKLPQELQEREFPSPRLPLQELAFEGAFPKAK
jgi:nitroreductase